MDDTNDQLKLLDQSVQFIEKEVKRLKARYLSSKGKAKTKVKRQLKTLRSKLNTEQQVYERLAS